MICEKCGLDFEMWMTTNEEWKKVVDNVYDVFCIDCFRKTARKKKLIEIEEIQNREITPENMKGFSQGIRKFEGWSKEHRNRNLEIDESKIKIYNRRNPFV